MNPIRHTAIAAAGLVLVLLAAVLVAVGPAGGASAATLFGDDFEDGNATGWSTSGGTWSVGTDGSRVYQQTGTSSDARARAGSSAWTNYAVSARIKPTGFNGADRHVAVLARSQSTSNYYYLGLSNAGSVVLGKRVGGGFTTLASAPAAVSVGTWYTVRLEAFGTTLRGFLNGAAVVSASDATFATGTTGLTAYFAGGAFDDVTVQDTSGPPTSTTTTTTTTTPPPPPPGGLVGWATVNALGQNGTTGGAGGPTVTVTTAAELADYAGRAGPFVIMVSGRIQFDDMITVVADKSIIGAGAGAEITGGGLHLGSTTRPGNNVIIRNLRFSNASDDSVSVTNSAHHVWIDHNEFLPGFDGSVDIKRQSSYVTVSWNWFRGTDKTALLGHSDGFTADIGFLKVTYHHNFFDGAHQRHPRVRFGEPVHVYNNYYLNNDLYGVASTMNAGVLVEGNYFENVPFPCFSASGYADSDPGRLVQRNNVFTNSGACEVAGAVAEPRNFYQYMVDAPANVPAIVRGGAGVGRI
ncbi:MAG TPA: hypothetical protein VGX25_22505 [Actinophytocola sp.]|uniref:pectate lyase family protein n=1 Tax=Actinophytocola sp. TaxID=1872138 RepID=UPI002DDD3A1A|nr:hypothetical protein [Actinophytocola sp.]HEV2782173.1 hypothetical protein [Actinophytocola sp.]